MRISHVPNMCWAFDVHLCIKSLQQSAEISITALISQMGKLRFSEVKQLCQVYTGSKVSGRAEIPVQPVVRTGPSTVESTQNKICFLSSSSLRCEDSKLAHFQGFSSPGQAPQPLPFIPKMTSPETFPRCLPPMGILFYSFGEQIWACYSPR